MYKYNVGWCCYDDIYFLTPPYIIQTLDTPPHHMTTSSSENKRWRQEAIKGLAEYCDAHRHCCERREATSSLPAKRVCVWALGKQHPRVFEVSIFLYAAAGLLPPPRAFAPPYLELTRVFRFSRWISSQNLRWSPNVSRLRSRLSTSIRHILSNVRRGSSQNMAKQFWWPYRPPIHFWKCSYFGVMVLSLTTRICVP